MRAAENAPPPGGKREGGAPDAGKQGAAGGKPRTGYPVRVLKIAARPVEYELGAVGTVEAQDVYRIDARVPGTLYDVNFNEGDEVKKDNVLCRIAPDAYRLLALKAEGLYRQAVADLADSRRRFANAITRARIQLANAELEIGRRKAVQDAGGISIEEIQLFQSKRDLAALELKDMTEAAETQVKVLEATVVEKEAAWKIAEDDVRKSTVLPPIEGSIEKRFVTSGMFVTAGTELASIVDKRTMKLIFQVPEKSSAILKPGVKVTFKVPAYPEREFEAEIYHIGDQMDRDARVVSVWSRVTKDASLLIPGYFASVKIVTGGNKSAVIVPTQCILPTEKGFVAFVAKESGKSEGGKEYKAERRRVTVGLTVTDNSTEILKGLNEGELLVLEGANALQDGFPLKLLDTQPEGQPSAAVPAGGREAVDASTPKREGAQ